MTGATPRTSIVVAVYNKAPYIRETLLSALAQTDTNLEIVAVDDGSTDDSLRVVNDVAAGDRRVRVITQANAGAALARNAGLHAARGQFVTMLDADDLLYPSFVERTVGRLAADPSLDIVHTSWHRIDDSGRHLNTTLAPSPDDYLKALLLGMLFAPSAMTFRKSLVDRVGHMRDGFNPTEDWEFVLRCAKLGARFGHIEDVLAAYREVPNSHRKIAERQQNRFFPVIESAFDGTMGAEYERLKPLSIVRHHLFLMEDYLRWGQAELADKQFETALALARTLEFHNGSEADYLAPFLPRMTALQRFRFVRALRAAGAPGGGVGGLLRRITPPPVKAAAKTAIRRLYGTARRTVMRIDDRLDRARRMSGYQPYDLAAGVTIGEIRKRSLEYVRSMRVESHGKFSGYRHSASTRRPVLYATVAALLLKHLYDARDDHTNEELEFLAGFQRDDGLFVDPVIQSPEAETEDWWGWRHLTLHALMTLALYERPARFPIRYVERFGGPDALRRYLRGRDWGARAAWTSNEVQNLGVMLQYARDFQSSPDAAPLMDVLFEVMCEKQDPESGLYGARFDSPEELSNGVQAGYHFWLLYFYDKRPIPRADRIVEHVLETQNPLGGYGVKWNSSACEDIDSVDPLLRFGSALGSANTRARVTASLARAMPAILQNLNADGGWVFRRHEALTVGHPEMYSAENESNMLYTWFRTLGLAYCLSGMDDVPQAFRYRWQFGWAPGHQFL